MIRKLKSGYRLYSRKKDPTTGKATEGRPGTRKMRYGKTGRTRFGR